MALLLLLLAQVVAAEPAAPAGATAEPASAMYGPSPPRAKTRKVSAAAPDPCRGQAVEPGVILVCGKRDDYRIDPNVLQAQRALRNPPRPKPRERFVDNSCKLVGQMGCITKPGIDVVQAVTTAAAMGKALVSGKNVGKMFVTEPELSEYQLYLRAKREREEAETGSSAVRP